MRLFVALVSLAAVAPSQEPPAIRVDVNLVNVAFAVRDAHGALAAGLTQDDFQVFEDGAPQKISFFARSADVPVTLGLIVDASGSQEQFVREHHHHLEKFFQDVLAPRDRAFLVCFGNHQRLVSDFSPASAPLMEGLKRFDKGDRRFLELGPVEDRELGTAFYDALYYALAYVSTNPVRDGSFRKVVIRTKPVGFAVRSKTGTFAR
jgi:Ca-activated chloride channel family protein